MAENSSSLHGRLSGTADTWSLWAGKGDIKRVVKKGEEEEKKKKEKKKDRSSSRRRGRGEDEEEQK